MFPGSGNRKNLYHPFRLLRCDSVLYTRCIKRTWWKCKEEVHLDSFCLFYYPSFYYFFKWMLNRRDLNQAALDHIKSYISFFFLLTLTSCVFFGEKKKVKDFPWCFYYLAGQRVSQILLQQYPGKDTVILNNKGCM